MKACPYAVSGLAEDGVGAFAFRPPSSGQSPSPSMNLQEFKAYVSFGDDDTVCLLSLWPFVEPHLDAICDDFYARAMAESSTVDLLHDPEQVARLMRTLRIWIRELLNGPWDEAYAVRRKRIGEVHVRVGVRHNAMFTAMSVMREWLIRAAFESPDPVGSVQAVSKVTNLDLALMTSTYHEVRSTQALRDVQALIVAHMPAMVILIAEDGTTLAATPSVAFRFGHDVVEGRPVSEILPPVLVHAIGLDERLQRAFFSGLGVTLPRLDLEIEGVLSHLAVTLVPVRRDVPVALLHIDDHTIAVRNEALLRRQESLATLGALSATIAHELRNPLAGISGALQVIASGMEPDNRFSPIIAKVLDQIRSLNRLVSDLLSFARPREAAISQGVDLRTLTEDVVTLASVDFPDIRFTVDGHGSVSADVDMLRQILHNLVNNSCEALDRKGHILIELSSDGFRFEDSGPGIPAEVQSRLFQPFFTTKLKGTGLGLATSARLAELMNAQLRLVEARQLRGAAFQLSFSN
jgi:signal transduction histidine kinase